MSNKIHNFKSMYNKDKESFKKNWTIFVSEGKNCINEFKNKETRHKQIPNAFTASRLFAPLFIIPSALSGNLILTALFAGGLLLPLIVFNPVIIANILLEATIAAINMHSRLNDNKPKTTIIGKVKTGSLSLTIILSYLNMVIAINPVIIGSLIATTGVLQTATAIKYYKNYKKAETLKELKNLSANVKNTEVNEKEKTEEKRKELVITKELPKQNIEKLSTTQKIDKLNNLKKELIIIPLSEEDTKLYEKK